MCWFSVVGLNSNASSGSRPDEALRLNARINALICGRNGRTFGTGSSVEYGEKLDENLTDGMRFGREILIGGFTPPTEKIVGGGGGESARLTIAPPLQMGGRVR